VVSVLLKFSFSISSGANRELESDIHSSVVNVNDNYGVHHKWSKTCSFMMHVHVLKHSLLKFSDPKT